MAEAVILQAHPRQECGSNKARSIRKNGLLPGVVYGHKLPTVPIAVSRDEFMKVIRHGARIVDLQTNGETETTLIREVQWDYLGHDIVHVDFARVSRDERITVEVKVELKGTAPGVTGGGVLEQVLHTLEIECAAMSVPDVIRVNINDLQMDSAIHVKDVVLPEGVVAVTDPDAVVVHVIAPSVEPEEGAAEIAAEQAEPELIKKPKEEEVE